jgi:hypothetical protein
MDGDSCAKSGGEPTTARSRCCLYELELLTFTERPDLPADSGREVVRLGRWRGELATESSNDGFVVVAEKLDELSSEAVPSSSSSLRPPPPCVCVCVVASLGRPARGRSGSASAACRAAVAASASAASSRELVGSRSSELNDEPRSCDDCSDEWNELRVSADRDRARRRPVCSQRGPSRVSRGPVLGGPSRVSRGPVPAGPPAENGSFAH